mgnify:CR=1 FL=1
MSSAPIPSRWFLRRSRYHTAFSLDSEDYEGTNLVSEKPPDDLISSGGLCMQR